jgi:hypothetical protein
VTERKQNGTNWEECQNWKRSFQTSPNWHTSLESSNLSFSLLMTNCLIYQKCMQVGLQLRLNCESMGPKMFQIIHECFQRV